MLAELKSHLESCLRTALAEALPGHDLATFAFDRPKQAGHGDAATNVALQLAKAARLNPRELAARIVAALPRRLSPGRSAALLHQPVYYPRPT